MSEDKDQLESYNAMPSFRDDLQTLPEYMRRGIEYYVMKGIKPGGFLESVICNDLFGATLRADPTNLHHLRAFSQFFTHHAPSTCHGSYAAFYYWLYTARDRDVRYDERGNLDFGPHDEPPEDTVRK